MVNIFWKLIIFLQYPLVSLELLFFINVVIGNDLPFQCPYKAPADSPQPSTMGDNGGGLLTTLYEDGILDDNDSENAADYRAALALVPCDAKEVSVFTNPLVAGQYAISVIYIYDKPVEDLKNWLR